MLKVFIISLVSLSALVSCAPQMPSPPMPPGMPSPPGMPFMAQMLTRVARNAPPPPPEGAPAPPSLDRVARQAPPPTEGPKRVARHALIESSLDAPKHITQEAFYSSITTVNREKRGTSRGR